MQLDPNIRIGDLITAGSIVAAIVGSYLRLGARLSNIETRLDPLWKEFTERRTTRRRVEDR